MHALLAVSSRGEESVCRGCPHLPGTDPAPRPTRPPCRLPSGPLRSTAALLAGRACRASCAGACERCFRGCRSDQGPLSPRSATTVRRRPCTTAAGTRPTAPSSASRSTGTRSTSAPAAGRDEGAPGAGAHLLRHSGFCFREAKIV